MGRRGLFLGALAITAIVALVAWTAAGSRGSDDGDDVPESDRATGEAPLRRAPIGGAATDALDRRPLVGAPTTERDPGPRSPPLPSRTTWPGGRSPVRGLVVDGGVPVAGAHVRYQSHGEDLTTTTDERGVFLAWTHARASRVTVRHGERGARLRLPAGSFERIALGPWGAASGRVVDAKTREPVPWATIVLVDGEEIVAQSQAREDGSFHVRGPVGTAQAWVHAPTYGWSQAPISFAIDVPVDVPIRSESWRAIEGIVRTRDGSIVRKARIRVPGTLATTAVGEDGRFRFEAPSNVRMLDVDGGGGFVPSHARIVGSTRDGVDDAEVEIFGPMSFDGVVVRDGRPLPAVHVHHWCADHGASSAKTDAVGRFSLSSWCRGLDGMLTVRTGGGEVVHVVRTFDLVLDAAASARVRGRVLDRDGKPVSGAELTARRADDLDLFVTEDDGRFEIAVPVGGLHLRVRALGFVPELVKRVVASGEVLEQDVVLWPGGALFGRVVDDRGEPVPQARVSVTGMHDGRSTGYVVTADRQGHWFVRELPGSTFRVAASAADHEDAYADVATADAWVAPLVLRRR